jgi:hypothetical protein
MDKDIGYSSVKQKCRSIKQITSNPGGQRGRGCPKLRWRDGVEEDARRFGCQNWKTAVQDRDG